jgi:hypothetical protein
MQCQFTVKFEAGKPGDWARQETRRSEAHVAYTILFLYMDIAYGSTQSRVRRCHGGGGVVAVDV